MDGVLLFRKKISGEGGGKKTTEIILCPQLRTIIFPACKRPFLSGSLEMFHHRIKVVVQKHLLICPHVCIRVT